MNNVSISGYIMDEPELREEQGGIAHLVFNLSVRHKTRAGEIRKESYRVSAWYKTAQWGISNLAKGQLVAIQGYLTQRQVVVGNIVGTSTEIVAEEFLPMRQPTAKEPVLEASNEVPNGEVCVSAPQSATES